MNLNPVAQEFVRIHATCFQGDRYQVLQSLEEQRHELETRPDLSAPETHLLLEVLGDYEKAVHMQVLPPAVPLSPDDLMAQIRAAVG